MASKSNQGVKCAAQRLNTMIKVVVVYHYITRARDLESVKKACDNKDYETVFKLTKEEAEKGNVNGIRLLKIIKSRNGIKSWQIRLKKLPPALCTSC